MSKPDKTAYAAFLPLGVGVGVAVGTGLGLAIDNLALGLSLGVAIGSGLGVALMGLGAATAGRKDGGGADASSRTAAGAATNAGRPWPSAPPRRRGRSRPGADRSRSATAD